MANPMIDPRTWSTYDILCHSWRFSTRIRYTYPASKRQAVVFTAVPASGLSTTYYWIDGARVDLFKVRPSRNAHTTVISDVLQRIRPGWLWAAEKHAMSYSNVYPCSEMRTSLKLI